METTDGRYVKILEIEPINFMLRSSEEQYNILSSFASWLKISPMKLQFKSITRKADSDKHIAMIRKELSIEDNAQCKAMGEDYIRLIKDVGSREALTRRFFLIYQYEAIGRSESDDYSKIYSMLVSAEQNARAYFMQCGNNIIQPQNPDQAVAEILYMFFNRRSCVDEPFTDRVNRVIIDTMAAKGKIIGIDPIPHISVRHFIAPRGLDLSHYNYIVMDGRYYCFLYIKGNGYPSTVRGGWMSSLINAGEGIDIDVHLSRENRSKTIDKVAQRIRLNRTKLKGMQDTSTDYEELTNSIQAGYYIKNGIANHNEDLFYMSVFVTISAKTYDELLWRKQQMTDMLKSMDMYLSDCRFQQEDALRSVMPFLQISPKLQKKTQRNVLTSGAASTYMFTSFEMSDDSGVLLGVNRHNNSLCIVDLFNTKHARRIAAIEDGEYLAVDQYCEPKQRMITAVWVLLQFIEQINPEAHWQADAPAQVSFLKDKTAYEIVVLYEDEDHLVRLLQPQEDTKYILVVPNMEFANKLILPDAPCLFATVDQTECEAPKITFYSS